MTKRINKDTQVCMSLAARPSNFGTRFHNYLYEALDLNYLYKAFSPTDLTQAISGVRGLGIRGCAISMPFKEACIPLVDELDASAQAIHSVNTIVNTNPSEGVQHRLHCNSSLAGELQGLSRPGVCFAWQRWYGKGGGLRAEGCGVYPWLYCRD